MATTETNALLNIICWLFQQCFSTCDAWSHLQLAAVGNGDGLPGPAAGGTLGLNSLDNINALGDPAKHDVLAVQPGARHSGDEELQKHSDRSAC